MECVISCDICSFEFNEEFVPKILDCGHSLCVSCISKLIESNSNCPQCRKELNKNKRVEDYPTNYSLLSSLTLIKKLKSMNSTQQMKKRISVQKEYLENKKTSVVVEIENNLAQLKELTNAKNEIIDMRRAEQVLDVLERKFKIEQVILSDMQRLRASIDINLWEYEDYTAYLFEIYRRLQNAEKIYTVKNIMDLVKYGKISVHDNTILFHSLSEEEKPEKSLFIWFEDLKNCVTESNFSTFVKLTVDEKGITQEVEIKMLTSKLATNFIALCTGECGSSYIGCKYNYYDSKHPHVTGFMEIDKRTLPVAPRKQNDFITKEINDTYTTRENDLALFYRSDGSFSISRVIANSIIPNVAGIVLSPQNFEDIIYFAQNSILEIVDCGIVIEL